MKTNKFIENSTKETLDRLKKVFTNKDIKYKETNQLALLKIIFNTKMSIDIIEMHIIELLQQDDIDIEAITNATKKYNKLCEKLDILNSYKTIFGIN